MLEASGPSQSTDKKDIPRTHEKWLALMWEKVERSSQLMMRAALIAATFGTPVSAAEKKNLPETTITLASGETVRIPSPKTTPLRELYVPKDGEKPRSLVLLFKQTHYSSYAAQALTDPVARWWLLSRTMHSQKSIYDSLKDMKNSLPLKSICVEGVVDGDENELLEYYSESLPDVVFRRTEMYVEGHDADSGRDHKGNSYIIGGGTLLALEGNVQLCGAESRTTYNAAWSDYIVELEKKNPKHPDVLKAVFEDREDAALFFASRQNQSVVSLSYGEGHYLPDALDRFNESNAENQLALAVFASPHAPVHFEKELFEIGMSFEAVLAVQFAFRLKSWTTARISESQFTSGVEWLEANAVKYKIVPEQLLKIREIVSAQAHGEKLLP